MNLEQTIQEITQRVVCAPSPEAYAHATFTWMQENITYDHLRAKNLFGKTILHPEETLARRAGICTDQAILYVTLARKFNLTAQYINVDIDENGMRVNHAAAIVQLERTIQVDPAYNKYDCHHQSYHFEEPIFHHPTPPLSTPQWLLALGIAGLAAIGATYLVNVHQPSTRFFTPNSTLTFSIDENAQDAWNEAVFFKETINGRLTQQELLQYYLATDTDNNKIITRAEAIITRDKARANNKP